jgi:hypothetical protein
MHPANVAATEAEALPLRREETTIRPVLRLIERLTAASALAAEAIGAERQAIEEQTQAAARRTRERVEALRLDLAALDSLDHGAGSEVVDWLDRLRAVADMLAAARLSSEVGGDGEASPAEDFPEIEFLPAEDWRRPRPSAAASTGASSPTRSGASISWRRRSPSRRRRSPGSSPRSRRATG